MQLMEQLAEAGALIQNRHFVYSRGQHGPVYVRIDALLSRANEPLLDAVCSQLVVPFADSGVEAITACDDKRCDRLAYNSAEHLGVKALSGERLRGKRTLIAEDVLTTGEGVRDIRRVAEFYGAVVVGATVIINRGEVTLEQLGVPRLETLADVPLTAFEADECELCQDSVPIVLDIGKGSVYQQTHPGYSGGYESLLAA